MANLLVLYTLSEPKLVYADEGYQRLLKCLRSFDYELQLTVVPDNRQLCGYLGEPSATGLALPTITLKQLADPDLLSNYLVEIIAAAELNHLQIAPSKAQLIDFHSRYKYLIMAYCQVGYRQLGPFVANIGQLTPALIVDYRQQLLKILAKGYTVTNQVNTLKHLQGYFRPHLTGEDKQQLSELIEHYRLGKALLVHVLLELKNYLVRYPNKYLSQQYYLKEYPNLLLSVAAVNP